MKNYISDLNQVETCSYLSIFLKQRAIHTHTHTCTHQGCPSREQAKSLHVINTNTTTIALHYNCKFPGFSSVNMLYLNYECAALIQVN